MSASIESLIHRCRRQMKRFLEAPEPPAIPSANGECGLGIYLNSDGNSVSFTTHGLRLNSRELICYRDIVATRVLGSKTEASNLELTLTDGSVEVAKFNGGSERFRDVWEILRLLDRIKAVVQPNINSITDLPS